MNLNIITQTKNNVVSIFILVFCLNLSSGFTHGQEARIVKEIKQVELLKDDKSKIEKLFGKPENSTFPYFKTYNLADGKLEVEYSRGFCSETKTDGLNTAEFVVQRIFFRPVSPLNITDVGINLNSFKKYTVKHVSDSFSYENEEIGINFYADSNINIDSFEFYPSNKFDDLFCK